MKTFTITYKVRPISVEHGGPTGAYVACWVKTSSVLAAKKQAEFAIRAYGWSVETVEEAPSVITTPSAEGAKYFEQAQTDGEVYVFHTWSGTDEERVH
ncbi:MAG: hypothetical protein ACT4PZ_15565 [Panacagrimonas sp.]